MDNTIKPGMPSMPNLQPPGPPAGTAAGQVPGMVASPTDAKQLAQMQELLTQISGGAQGKSGKGDEVTDARGAPAIDGPAGQLGPDDMIELLRNLRSKSQDQQLAAAKSSVETAQIKAGKNTENQLKKIDEWVQKSREADKQGLLGKIFGWIGKIVAVIAAIAAVAVAAVATVASGGAAAPLLALATIGLIGATISLADQISKECGGPEISIGNLLMTMTSKFLEACGVPEDKAQQIGRVMAGAMAMMCPAMLLVEPQLLGTMATGICQLAGADEQTTQYVGMAVGMAAALTVGIGMAVASGGSSAVSSSVKMASAMIAASSAVVTGATTAATGGIAIAKAHTQRDAEGKLAEKKELEAAMVKLQKTMEEGREELKKVIQQIEDSLQAVSQMINGAAESMSQITANIGKRQAV
ncbi:hypothetical protein SAMN05216567_111130 [Variovorax sp. OK605]|jgi:hypothetical protein|uniref:type III secretion system translocon subunit SctE n=1 Tax=Variovorax sp. OK605 TaxID=1855317 RepID=UPI0008EB3594|nr:type III secretion system translocon subunit SctE [Variovorax sp. OK605]SFQ12553.1 hypothetical protein SAMN05216567_111130 [Variovorax sp. OK605]